MSEPTTAEPVPIQRIPLARILSLAGLALLLWGVISQVVGLDTSTEQWVAAGLLVVAGRSWIVALVIRQDESLLSGFAIGAMALTGGALAPFAPLALVFAAVAVLGAAIRWRIRIAVLVASGGWMALAVTSLALGWSPGVVFGSLAAMLAGALVGMARRQTAEQAVHAAHAEVEAERAEVERQRAELLAERNHMAREIHDVLAHTLAALSLQLEAFGTVVDADAATTPAIRDQLDRTRRLVREGLDEARRAVSALRDDHVPLDELLQRLSDVQDSALVVSGTPEHLPPPVVSGLFRVAQESLTNVMKHAPGSPTAISLTYAPDQVSIVVVNRCGSGPRELHESGGGFGLQGIGERLALLGGHLEAGPTADGWRVSADVPLPAPARQGSTVR